MTKKDPNILRAERLRAVMNMPEYEVTIGAWLKEAKSEADYQLQTATEPHEIHRAQGKVALIRSIDEQFERVFACEKKSLEKSYKRQKET